MATKFIDLETAAEQLGISAEQLTEMRENNVIRGFRDGATWKFKPEDLERVKATLDAGGSELDLDDRDDSAPEPQIPDSILLSEVELGGSGTVGSSTVIGQTGGGDAQSEDVRITVDALDTSDIQLTTDSLILGAGDGEPSSDVLGGEASGSVADAGSEIQLAGSEGPDLELNLSDSGTSIEEKDGVAVGESDLLMEGSDASGEKVAGGSEIDMTGDDEDVLVLGGTGSDVVGASDSGISLSDPADSGISLEGGEMDLGGSVIGDDSLLLGEEDLLASGSGSDEGSPSQLQQDDDFLLTPLEDALTDDSESSSQVITLEDPDVSFDASGDTLMESTGDEDLAMLDPEIDEEGEVAALIQGGPEVAQVQQPLIPEAPYSAWNVISLFLCITLLSMAGMLIYEVVEQIWSWQGPDPINSALMDAILKMFG